MKVSVYWLNQATGKHTATIRKRISNLIPDAKGKFDSVIALEAIYCGLAESPTGEFISTPEAVRQLTIAKKEEIDLEMEIKRGQRLPHQDVMREHEGVFKMMSGILKANRGKMLSIESINDIFDQFRAIGKTLMNGSYENQRRDQGISEDVVSAPQEQTSSEKKATTAIQP